MKSARLVLAALVLVVAGLQFNDPDPAYWVAVYAATAAAIAASAFGRLTVFRAALVAGALLAGMLMTVSGAIDYLASTDYGAIVGEMRPDKPYVEEAREFLGLGLALAALAWSARR